MLPKEVIQKMRVEGRKIEMAKIPLLRLRSYLPSPPRAAACGAAFAFLPWLSPAVAADNAVDIEKAAEAQGFIYTMLTAWASDGGHAYPNLPGNANANFRQLFRRRLAGVESIFGVAHDGWCLKGKPDGNIGNHPDFVQALEPGELSLAYVAGHQMGSDGDLPLMISGAGPATAWITGVAKTPPAVVFTGKVAVTFVGGSTEVLTPDPDGKIRKSKAGKPVDIFSKEYGTNPENIRLPAPLPKPKEG